MKITIDKAGRVVIPAGLREQLGLVAGTELEVSVEDLSIRLTRAVAGPVLARTGSRTVVRPTVAKEALPPLDPATLVEEERDRWPV